MVLLRIKSQGSQWIACFFPFIIRFLFRGHGKQRTGHPWLVWKGNGGEEGPCLCALHSNGAFDDWGHFMPSASPKVTGISYVQLRTRESHGFLPFIPLHWFPCSVRVARVVTFCLVFTLAIFLTTLPYFSLEKAYLLPSLWHKRFYWSKSPLKARKVPWALLIQ